MPVTQPLTDAVWLPTADGCSTLIPLHRVGLVSTLAWNDPDKNGELHIEPTMCLVFVEGPDVNIQINMSMQAMVELLRTKDVVVSDRHKPFVPPKPQVRTKRKSTK
jgi:hypothetical protein